MFVGEHTTGHGNLVKKVQLSHLPLAFECMEILVPLPPVVTCLGVLELLTERQPDEEALGTALTLLPQPEI